MALQPETVQENSYKPHYALWAGMASVATVALLIALKLFAFWQSESVSILATLIDSLSDAVVSVISFMAIRYSLKPADEDHRYGHGKVEGLAALFQAAFIVGAGVFLVFESISRFASPHPVTQNGFIIGIMTVSILLSALLVFIQNHSLKYAPSLAVEADKAHYSGDIAVNGGVVAVLVALQYGAPAWIDPAFAVVVAFYLAGVALVIAMKGVDMLLDRELPADLRKAIATRVLSHEGVMGIHDLRTYKSGMTVFISFDIELDPDLVLREAHEIVREVELELLQDFPHAEILIHADPAGDTHDTRHQVSGVHH